MERELEKCRERVGRELGCGSHGYSGDEGVVLAYARRRIGAGASVREVGSEVGLSAVTLARWLRGPRSGSQRFLPVESGSRPRRQEVRSWCMGRGRSGGGR